MEPAAASDAPKYGSNSQIRCQSGALQVFCPENAKKPCGHGAHSRVLGFPVGPAGSIWEFGQSRALPVHGGTSFVQESSRQSQTFIRTGRLDTIAEHCNESLSRTPLWAWHALADAGFPMGSYRQHLELRPSTGPTRPRGY